MVIGLVLLCISLGAGVTHVSAAAEPGFIETLLLATHQRPWLWSIYVFTVALPIILFISFMWPDVRFGPADEQYYYKKSDDAQPDDPAELSQHTETQARVDRRATRRRDAQGSQKRSDLNLKDP